MTKNSVDLNTADHKTLEQIQGVGPAFAAKIIFQRRLYGIFKSWEDVKTIPGLPDYMIDTLKQQGVTIGRVAA
jgi:competence protein ComEA